MSKDRDMLSELAFGGVIFQQNWLVVFTCRFAYTEIINYKKRVVRFAALYWFCQWIHYTLAKQRICNLVDRHKGLQL